MAAPTPLFIDTIANVKARLRLSGVPAGVDATALIEEAVRDTRVGFFRKLSAERITELQAITLAGDDAADANEALRVLAEQTELKWIRYELMRTMPIFFYDSAPSVDQSFNDEGLLRGVSSQEQKDELARLENDIDLAIEALRGTEMLPDELTVQTTVIAPDSNSYRPVNIWNNRGWR